VREQRFDALVLRDVVHDAEQAAIVGPILGHLDDVDLERAASVLEPDLERDRLAFEARASEGRDVRYEHVGRQYGTKVVAEMPFELEPEQVAVAGVGVNEAADLVFTDPDDERGLRQRVEYDADVGGGGRGNGRQWSCATARSTVGRGVCPSPRLRPIHWVPSPAFSPRSVGSAGPDLNGRLPHRERGRRRSRPAFGDRESRMRPVTWT